MKIKLMAAVAAAALAAAANAHAATPGWYVAADVGYHWPSDFEGASFGQPNVTWEFRGENDWSAYVRAGHAFEGSGLRLELEAGNRPNDINRVFSKTTTTPVGLCAASPVRTAAAPTCGDIGGSLSVKSLMLNVAYEFMPESRVRPFVGVGLGVTMGTLKASGALSNTGPGQRAQQVVTFDDTDREIAWQTLFGASYDLSPKLTVDLTARYARSATYAFASNTTAGEPAGPGTLFPLGEFQGRYKDAALTVGLRYAFGAP